MNLRHMLVTAAVAGTAGALALTAPVVARSVFDANNAHKVDGLHAAQLTKIQSFADDTVFDDFDSCPFTTVLSRTFKAPHGGVLAVTGQIGAARDASDLDDGILTAHIVIDGKRAGTNASVNLENAGNRDASVNPIGARKVKSGNHTIEIRAAECSSGMAFIHNQSMIATFSPFGAAPKTPVAAKPGKRSLNR